MKVNLLTWILIGVVVILLGLLTYFTQYRSRKIVTRTDVITVPVKMEEKDDMILEYIEKFDSAAALLIKKNDEIRRYTRVISEFRQDTLRIPVKADTVYRTVFKEKEKIVERVVYQGFNYADKTLSISGKITPTELQIDSLTVKSNISLIRVDRKEKGFLGIFNKRVAKIIAVSSDPRISLGGTTEKEVIVKDGSYAKGFTHGVAVGVAGGAVGTAAVIK